MQIINRNLLIAKPKQPYVDWINVQPDQEPPMSLAYIQRDCHIYLIPEMVNEEEALEYIQAFKLDIFEIELDSWSRDNQICPRNASPL